MEAQSVTGNTEYHVG